MSLFTSSTLGFSANASYEALALDRCIMNVRTYIRTRSNYVYLRLSGDIGGSTAVESMSAVGTERGERGEAGEDEAWR